MPGAKERGSWRWWLLPAALGILLGLLGLLTLFLLAPEKLVEPDGAEYGSSLAAEVGHAGGECDRHVGAAYLCGVETTGYSGVSRSFRLTPKDGGCWSALPVKITQVKTPGGGHRTSVLVQSRHPLSGCVGVRDYVFPHEISEPGGD